MELAHLQDVRIVLFFVLFCFHLAVNKQTTDVWSFIFYLGVEHSGFMKYHFLKIDNIKIYMLKDSFTFVDQFIRILN